MGVTYILVNRTQRECINFRHVGAEKARELAGNPASAAIVTWYLLQHRGDTVAFVPDESEWPFSSGSRAELDSYADVTDRVVDALIDAGILADHGMRYVDEDDPDEVYVRDLRNVWWSTPTG